MYVTPYIYVAFILFLPFETPGWLLLLSAFVLGITMDVFPQGWVGQGGTLGMHAAAAVLTAFMRPVVLIWINPRDEYEPGSTPSASDYGFRWFFVYLVLLTTIHHSSLFFLEQMSLIRFAETLLRIFFSVGLTVFLVMIWEGFRYHRK